MKKDLKEAFTISLTLLVINGIITEEEINNVNSEGYDGILELLSNKYEQHLKEEKMKNESAK